MTFIRKRKEMKEKKGRGKGKKMKGIEIDRIIMPAMTSSTVRCPPAAGRPRSTGSLGAGVEVNGDPHGVFSFLAGPFLAVRGGREKKRSESTVLMREMNVLNDYKKAERKQRMTTVQKKHKLMQESRLCLPSNTSGCGETRW